MENDNSLGVIVRKLEQDFISGTGTLMSKYVRTDLYEDINKIYAYVDSKHVSGEFDSMGREKPFFNIVIASRNIWFRATDIDTKDIKLTPRKTRDVIGAFLLNVHLQKWMTKSRFGTFLNTWGLDLATFNSSVVKFVEKDGELNVSVVPWSRLIVDQINFDKNPKIELLELTEAELYSRGYDEEQVDALCESARARELTSREKKDNKNNYYKVYEVHGEFPLSYITGKEKDEDTFVQQMQVLSFVAKEKSGKKTQEWDEFALYKGKEEQDPYILTSLFPNVDGSVSLNGSVKNLFEAQWMMNHTKKAIKDQLDLASKLIFQTSDINFVGQNAINAIETGDILVHQINQPLTSVANTSHDISALQSFGAEWKNLSSEINGVSDAMLGVAPKSGTAWKQTEALLTESHSLFEQMTENKGLCIEDMLRLKILPFLKKKMNHSDEISATLEAYEISKIDKQFVPYKATEMLGKEVLNQLLTGKIPTDLNAQLEENKLKVQEDLASLGNQRFFKPEQLTQKTWKELFKDLETDVEINVTGESTNTQEVLQTLNTALSVAANPNFANNPKAQFIVDKILMKTGHISPLELSEVPEPTPIQQPLATPSGGGVGAMALPTNPA